MKFLIFFLVFLGLLIGVGIAGYFLGLQKGEEFTQDEISSLKSELADARKTINELQGSNPSDPKPLEEVEPPENNSPTEKRYLFRSALNKTTFQYPTDWVVTSIVGKNSEYVENPRTYYVTSPSGSKLIYYEADILQPFGVEEGCDETDPTGANAFNLYSCVFVGEGSERFARYKELELNIDEGDWFVAEKFSEGTFYVVKPGDNFKLEVRNSKDLAAMDEMIKSVERE